MSVVACRITKGGYEIAADSISVRWATQEKGDRSKLSKLTSINGLDIGASGDVGEIGMFYTFASTRRPERPTEAALLEFLAEFSKWKKDRIGGGDLKAAYLIGYEGHVFYVSGWCITEVATFEAIGAGMDFALAALHLGHTAEEAVEVATELSIYCEKPVQVIRREDKHGEP